MPGRHGGHPMMNKALWAIDRGRGAAWAVSIVALALVVLGAASGGPPLRPDPQRTPGATLEVTTADMCVPGYTKKVRDVPASVKRQVYAAYGIQTHAPREYEVDHLIPLELGGSNALTNLWPQSYQTQPWNARVKDKLENHLHDLVCDGKLDLNVAQHDIATDWIAAYQKYFHTELPLTQTPARSRGRRAE
jgi:hypothetical protein